jgi:hypothetical protein
MVALDAFNYAWFIGLLCFGLHLILLGYLVVKSGYVSKALRYVLMVAGGAYAIDTLANALLSNYEDFDTVFPGHRHRAVGNRGTLARALAPVEGRQGSRKRRSSPLTPPTRGGPATGHLHQFPSARCFSVETRAPPFLQTLSSEANP